MMMKLPITTALVLGVAAAMLVATSPVRADLITIRLAGV
jgi:hypothetical protein